MDVLFCSMTDWANVGRAFAEALQRVGVDAVSVVKNQHPRKYSLKSEVWENLEHLQSFVEATSGAVVWMHSENFKHMQLNGQRLAVFCGGTRYRERGKLLNQTVFNQVADLHLIQTGDLLDYGARRQVWVIPPVDMETLKPSYKEEPGKLAFAHYPRSPACKGSTKVRTPLGVLRDEGVINFRYDGQKVLWKANMERMRKCDVYVERNSLFTRGFPTGTWGVQAMEAAALGKIVVTNDLYRAEYEEEFGPCPIVVANSMGELMSAARDLASFSLFPTASYP